MISLRGQLRFVFLLFLCQICLGLVACATNHELHVGNFVGLNELAADGDASSQRAQLGQLQPQQQPKPPSFPVRTKRGLVDAGYAYYPRRGSRNDALRHALRIKRPSGQLLGHALRIKRPSTQLMGHALRIKRPSTQLMGHALRIKKAGSHLTGHALRIKRPSKQLLGHSLRIKRPAANPILEHSFRIKRPSGLLGHTLRIKKESELEPVGNNNMDFEEVDVNPDQLTVDDDDEEADEDEDEVIDQEGPPLDVAGGADNLDGDEDDDGEMDGTTNFQPRDLQDRFSNFIKRQISRSHILRL